MKNHLFKSFVMAISCLLTSFSFSQGFQISSVTAVQNGNFICDSTVEISVAALNSATNTGFDYDLAIVGSNFTASQFQVIIDWGDGNTSTHYGGTSTSGTPIAFNPPITHDYSTIGSHTVIVQVINLQNTSSAFVTLTPNTQTCTSYIYSPVGIDCNNDGTIESQLSSGVPLIISDGTNTYTGITSGNMAQISGIPQGTYTISVDPFWLNTNNYTISSISPSTMVVVSNMTTYTTQIVLGCATPSGTSQCISGTVFCDLNGNNVMDGNEQGFPNAPINIQANGQNYSAVTDPNGYYSITYSAPASTAAIVQLNPNWLTANGLTTTQPIYCLISTDCSQTQVPANFPINCNVTPTTGCVSGFVWCDANSDGDFDANEIPLIGAPVMLQGSQINVTVYSDSTGFYSYCGNLINQSYAIGSINSNWLSSHGYTITNNNYTMLFMPSLNTQPLGLGVNCGGTPTTCSDLWTTVTPWIGYFQNQTNYIHLNYGNYGPGAPGNYTVSLTYPAGVTPITSSINNPNYTISGNTITWTLSNSNTWFSFDDVIYFNTPSGIPSGTAHYFTSAITPTGSVTDCCTANNAGSLLQLVGNSYDPNDKSVNKEEGIATAIQDELTYTIRFQNTGTAPAQDVYIIDTLSANLDWSTLRVLNTSHTMQLIDLGNGVIRFDFPQIWLPDSTSNEPMSHGQVVFSIEENAGNQNGSEIFNTGYIYFDWNPAIITNTTHNINGTLGVNALDKDNLLVYPNPVADELTIKGSSIIQSIQVVSISGQLIASYYPHSLSTNINTADLTNGIYLLQIQTENGTTTKKISKK